MYLQPPGDGEGKKALAGGEQPESYHQLLQRAVPAELARHECHHCLEQEDIGPNGQQTSPRPGEGAQVVAMGMCLQLGHLAGGVTNPSRSNMPCALSRCHVAWCGVAGSHVMWCCATWYGMVPPGVVPHGATSHGMAWHGPTCCGMVPRGGAWHGPPRHGVVPCRVAWHGVSQCHNQAMVQQEQLWGGGLPARCQSQVPRRS